jgi:hypothetical protein
MAVAAVAAVNLRRLLVLGLAKGGLGTGLTRTGPAGLPCAVRARRIRATARHTTLRANARLLRE